MDMLEVERQALRGIFCGSEQRLIIGLRQEDEPAVVAKVSIAQLRVFIDLQRPDHQAFEMLRKKIRQIECARFFFGQRCKPFRSSVELVTVCAG